ncbi:putative glycosyltransferase family 2 [Synechococcus sp. CC9902]|uniref:glycosyltransferase n=1 Tax=Synechococcus sp. (strain CC9902) TaxID=316279 RepID=UPI00005D406A|nr:glycosyltransferase family 2 protein [Synechococcus sp. CC9902]ABB25957.1 putative glycosyltransferase family 2 [Synechococcus sp. CC9902]
MTNWIVSLICLVLTASSCLGLLILWVGLKRVFQEAPQLNPSIPSLPVDAEVVDGEGISLTVVIPAFNESLNIKRSLGSVFQSLPPCGNWHVVVVDDMSTDSTVDMAQECAKQMDQLNRFTLIQAGPRPADERWVGKNWACSKAMEQLKSSWVLFIDADVELRPTALRRALVQAIHERADLFSVAPRLVCTCLAEWMVQPIMASLLGLGFPIVEANDPSSDVAFAAGPFMLFRRSAYDAIGGHAALAGEVVEDLALARTIKTSGFRLRYVLGLDAVDLQMYPNLSALWEGWTKNWFLGLDRNIPKALAAGGVVMLMFASPWILLPTCAVLAVVLLGPTVMIVASALLAAMALVLQIVLRFWIQDRFGVPMRFWWLMGAGGLLVGAIAPVSVWRSITGRGWTWKGRSLA